MIGRNARAMWDATYRLMIGLTLLATGLAHAGGSNYGITPGARPQLAGKISEWQVPTPAFAREQTFREWELPPGAQPHGVLVDGDGQVWYTGWGNGTIGQLDLATGKVIEHQVPAGGDSRPHTLVLDDQGVLWFTLYVGNRIGRLERRTGAITEFEAAGRPYGIALDRAGHVWFCQIGAHTLGKLDPKSGTITELALERGSRPRRMAAAPDGSLWVTLYGKGALLRVDPIAGKVVREYALPAEPLSDPYAVTVDGAGMVWANEFSANTVVRLDPRTDEMRVFTLPSKGVGIRKMIVDAEGRLWYMGSHNGQLGVIE